MRHRRQDLALFALAAALLSVAAAAPELPDLRTRATGSDWPTFLGPDGNGSSPETGLVLSWPSGEPPERWSRPVGEGYAGVSTSRGRLFLFDRHGDEARLTCLRSESGETLWQAGYRTRYEDYYDFSNGPRATPVVDRDRVYTYGAEGRLRCHRAADGALLWEVDTGSEFGVVQNFFGVGSTPVVEGELLIVAVGGSPPGSPRIHSEAVRGNGSGIVAFDKLTGEVRYRVTDELASYSSPVVTTIGGRRWGFLFARGGLVGFEPRSGAIDFHFRWRARKLQSVNAANPVVVDDLVLISESYGPGTALLQVRPGGYEVVWKDPPRRGQSLQAHWATPIHHRGTVYGCSGEGRAQAELRAVELATGRVRWAQPGLGRVTLLLVDGHLLTLGESGTLRVLEANPERYQLVSELRGRLRGPTWSPPVLSHGFLYLKGGKRIVCLDLARPSGATSSEGPGEDR